MELALKPTWTLLRILRKGLGLTGTKKGCEQGDCGACTVFMNRKAVDACLVLALQAESKETETIEGLGHATTSIHYRRVSSKMAPFNVAFVHSGSCCPLRHY